MPKKKETWEAENWEELDKLLITDLANGMTPLDFVKNMLHRRELQRLGDKRRNLKRAAILEHVRENPELEADILKQKGLK